MRIFDKKYVLRQKIGIEIGGGLPETKEIDFEKSNFVYGEKRGDFQENKYEVFIRKNGAFSEIKIDDSGANTIIKKVPVGKEQVVLDSFYGRYEDTICSTSEYTYNSAIDAVKHAPKKAERIISESKAEIAPIKAETLQIKLNELQKTQPDLYRKLMASGILKNSIENTKQLEKLSMYIKYLNFLYDVTRVSDTDPSETSQEISKGGKQKIVKMYRELLSEKTDFIEDKEFLQYKYMEAIIRDIRRMGYFVQKSENGGYIVKDLNTGKEVNNSKIGVYKDVFEVGTINNHAIDTALLANVIVSNKEFDSVLNQKQFINKLFEKYGIIANVKDEDKTKYLIVKGDKIKKQISDKLAKSKSGQEIRELSILQNFIENKTWEDDSSYDRFNLANTYAKGFLKQKAFIDAYKAGKLPGLDDPTKSTEDKIADMLKNNRFPAAMFGIVAWLMGYKKTGLGAIGFGLFGGAIADVISDTTKIGKDVINGNDSIIKPIEKDQIGITLSNTEYQDKYQELVAFNSKVDNGDLIKSGEVYIDDSMDQLSTEKLNNLIEYIVSEGIDLNLSDFNIVDQLKDKISGSTTVEITSLVKLLKKSGIKEDGDQTILDYLTKGGRDILNRPFKSIEPTGVNIFDEKIILILKNEFDNPDTSRENKNKILRLKDKISSDFSTISTVSNAIEDTINRSNLNSNKAIESVLSYVNVEYPTLETSFTAIFDNYKKYETAKEELSGFEGLYDENILDLETKVKEAFGNIDYAELYKKVNLKIIKLEKIKISDPLGLEEPFLTLNSNISTLITNLEKSKKELLKKADESGNTIKNDWAKNVTEDFKNKPQVLGENISGSLKKVNDAINSIKQDDSLDNINDKLATVKDDYKNLLAAETSLTSIVYSTDSMEKTLQTNITKKIAEFTNKKIELEKAVKDSLTKFYTDNNKQISNIGNIKLKDSSNIITETSLTTAITSLNKTKQFLAYNGYDVRIEEVVPEVKESITPNSPIIAPTVSGTRFDTEINGYLKSITDTMDEYKNGFNNTVNDSIKTIQKTKLELEGQINTYITKLKKFALDKDLSISDTNKITESITTLFAIKTKDTKAKESLKQARIFTGFELKDSTGAIIDKKGLVDVNTVYETKKESMKVEVKQYVEDLTVGTNKTDIVTQYKLLENIEKNFPSLKKEVEVQNEKLLESYKKNVNLGENTQLLNALKTDLNAMDARDIFKQMIISLDSTLTFNNVKIEKIESYFGSYIQGKVNTMKTNGKTAAEITTFVEQIGNTINDKFLRYNGILEDSNKLLK